MASNQGKDTPHKVEKIKEDAFTENDFKVLSEALSGAMGIAQVMRETDYSALTEPEDPIRMLGLADGLGVLLGLMFSRFADISYRLGIDDGSKGFPFASPKKK